MVVSPNEYNNALGGINKEGAREEGVKEINLAADKR